MTRWWGHLRIKVLAFAVAMSVLPLSLYGFYGLASARTAQAEVVGAQNRAAAQAMAGQLSRSIRQIAGQLELLARLEGARLPAAAGAEQERMLYTLLRDLPPLEEVALADGQGRELRRASRREVVAGTSPREYGGTPLWSALADRSPAMGAVTLDLDGRPLAGMAVALPDGGGALLARISLRALMADFTAAGETGDARVQVIDEAGHLVGATDFSLVLAGARPSQPPESVLQNYTSATGESALGVAVPVPGLAWQVVAETPMSLAMKPVRQLAVQFAAGALALITAVIVLSVVFGLQLTRPLEQMESGARQVGAGDLAVRIPEGGHDELGRLAQAFNAMTGQLQAQADALRTERDRLDLVVSSIGAGLALIDSAGQILWVNRTLAGWFGENLIGRPCREALNRSDCQGCAECRGAERPAMIGGRARLLRHHSYKVGEGRLEVLEDVTERRSMEAMILQSEKLAAVGQLAAGVAHEINNPLAVISAYAEDLGDRLKDEGAARLDASGELETYLTQLRSQVQRCKGITANLLDFARRGPAEPEPVDAAEVARRTAALVAPRARKAGVAVTVAAPAGLPPVRASQDQLQQVFLNLIANALDALEEAAGRITVTVERADPFLALTVTDDGPGMDPATLERAMEPFFTTKPPGRGTGLGLSTCYGIITGLGGSMELTSSPGAGTAVRFTLPIWGEPHAQVLTADR